MFVTVVAILCQLMTPTATIAADRDCTAEEARVEEIVTDSDMDDYETWAQFTKHEDGGSFVGTHDEDEHAIFAYCGPFVVPAYVYEGR